jgi:hypothetical protein
MNPIDSPLIPKAPPVPLESSIPTPPDLPPADSMVRQAANRAPTSPSRQAHIVPTGQQPQQLPTTDMLQTVRRNLKEPTAQHETQPTGKQTLLQQHMATRRRAISDDEDDDVGEEIASADEDDVGEGDKTEKKPQEDKTEKKSQEDKTAKKPLKGPPLAMSVLLKRINAKKNPETDIESNLVKAPQISPKKISAPQALVDMVAKRAEAQTPKPAAAITKPQPQPTAEPVPQIPEPTPAAAPTQPVAGPIQQAATPLSTPPSKLVASEQPTQPLPVSSQKQPASVLKQPQPMTTKQRRQKQLERQRQLKDNIGQNLVKIEKTLVILREEAKLARYTAIAFVAFQKKLNAITTFKALESAFSKFNAKHVIGFNSSSKVNTVEVISQCLIHYQKALARIAGTPAQRKAARIKEDKYQSLADAMQAALKFILSHATRQ